MLPQQVAKPWGLPAISLTVQDMPIDQLLSTVAFEAGASITIPPGIDSTQLVTADYQDQPAQRIVEELAQRFEHVAEYQDGLISFLPRDKAHRDFMFIRSGHGDPQVVQRSLQSMLGGETTVEILDDRILVSGDRRALEQASKYAKHLERGADAWLLDVHVVRITETLRTDLGIDWNVRGELALNTARPGSIVNADAFVSLIAEAVQIGTHATLEQTASLYCLEGKPSSIEQGQRVPIPRYSTSPEGTTTLVGYDYITAGFTLNATARRVPGGALLDLEPSISNVTGFVQDAPITNESTVRVTTIVNDGQWVIITGLQEHSNSTDQKHLPGLPAPIFGTQTDTEDEAQLVIMIQANRVYSSS